MQITRSTNFSYQLSDGSAVTTHWLAKTAADGSPADIPVEQLIGLPTSYPVDPELDGLSGDYHAFVEAQMGGRNAARAYAARHSEAQPDPAETERRRQRLLARIARAAATEQGTKSHVRGQDQVHGS
jgi:hypothetical protein